MASFESRGSTRARLHKLLEDRRLHAVLLVLLVIDVFLVVLGSVLEVHYVESKYEDAEKVAVACAAGGVGGCVIPDEYGDHYFHDAEIVCILLSMTILAVFLAEHLLHMFVLQRQYFSNWHHPFDLFVVIVALSLEIFALTGNLHVSLGIMVSARLWRFVRIVHGSAELVHAMGDSPIAHKQDKDLNVAS
ncbi:unnamed protein product [Prorocentrum cordatum]|uniref:Voltage-gated hydrogen channel 1 n=1 Tax=Prorocentrum cordatum TaxID=2364126 RepID=A0ABN9X8M5_9DINO|nr:unnamed protein product [Polarella glacialis]